MALTALQIELLSALRLAVAAQRHDRIVYRSEYLGYLPFGMYHWIDLNEHDISRTFPSSWCLEWSQRDLDALAAAGFLAKVEEWHNPDDELESSTTYDVFAA